MKDTMTSVRGRLVKGNVPTDPAFGIRIVPRSISPVLTDVPSCENPPVAVATATFMGSPRAAAGTSTAKTKAAQTTLILAPFSLEYTFLQTPCPEVRENFPHTPNPGASAAHRAKRRPSVKPNNSSIDSCFHGWWTLW